MKPVIPVACGVLRRPDGRVLLAQRPPGKIAALKWEFPGGKIEKDEAAVDALARELHEELGVAVREARPLIRFTHAYSDRIVILDTWLVTGWDGELQGRESQRFEWIAADAADGYDVLPTVLPILAALALPSDYVFTPPEADERRIRDGLAGLPHGALLRLRLPFLDEPSYEILFARVRPEAHALGLRLIADRGERRSLDLGADGTHVPEHAIAHAPSGVPDSHLRIASCHGVAALARAAQAGFGAAVAGPVHATPTHPGETGMGWTAFGALLKTTNLPVYAIGGVGPRDRATAWAHHAQGVAGISAYWRRGGAGGSGGDSSSPSASTAGME